MGLVTYVPPIGPIVAGIIAGYWSYTSLPETSGIIARESPVATIVQADAAPTSTEAPLSIVDLSAYDASIWQRPLFLTGRRIEPPVSVVEVIPAPEVVEFENQPINEPVELVPPPPAPELRMLGSMTREGQTQALLQLSQSESQFWATEGDEVAGWILTKISQDSIHLSNNSTEVTIQLFE